MFKINDKFSTELGYRYLKQDYTSGSINPGPGPSTFALNYTEQIYLSLAYHF